MFRTGIVGCGRIGSEFDDDPKREHISTHAGAYAAVNETELVAVCDLNEEKLEKCKKKWNVPSAYTDYQEMIQKEKLGILSVCTLSDSHLEITREAVKNNVKAIFCEKPIADTLTNAEEMIKLCRENEVLLIVDHQRRFDRFHQQIKEFIQNGKLGRVQQVSAYYTAGIANTGTHLFDMLRFFFGDVAWIIGNYRCEQEDPDIDVVLEFNEGFGASIQSLDVKEYLIFEIDIYGSSGRLRITNSGFGLEYYAVEDCVFYSGYKELSRSKVPFQVPENREFMVSAIEHIINCIKTNKEPVSTGEDGKAALELICAAHVSAQKDGEKIYLPLDSVDIGILSS